MPERASTPTSAVAKLISIEAPLGHQHKRGDMAKSKTPAENSKKAPRGKPFQPGKTGNPGGRPKLPEDVKHVRELARQYTPQAVQALVDTLKDGGWSAKVAAANVLLDRGWGKAEQPIVGDEGGPVRHSVRIIFE